jgi:uncharacterized protein YyaL (SSP411 family)
MANALIHETSPYLLQHAHNPVDWRGWGEEAFEQAQREGKLVFLSVGYSTCHWCHVMEHECFENEAVAAVMNHHFVNLKVDREERPDLDGTYMAYVQASTGQGGWPMSVWLTPEGKPVFGGTYFPPEDRQGRPGFVRVCHELARLWRDDRGRMAQSAEKAMAHLREESRMDAVLRGVPGERVYGDFLDRCEGMFDPQLGGFGGAPKFPRPVLLRTLMQVGERFGFQSEEGEMAWKMAERTLRAMAAGGMHDHLGGGFHRYSVDRFWHIPHYEKMLYDQGQLALAYLEAWQISGEAVFRETAEGIFRYLLETLRDAGGAFHAAEDADSLPSAEAGQKKEGAFWVWRAEEVSTLLEPREAALFSMAYGVEAAGNARPSSDPHGELEGTNTLFRATSDEDLALAFDLPEEEVRRLLSAARERLLEARGKRPAPHRDDKILSAWNGLAIAALARGARVLDRADLAEAAAGAARFLKEKLWDGRRLFRSFRGHRGATPGFAADFVFVISGLIELHAVRPADGWLAWAGELQQGLDAEFWDETRVGYVMRSGLGNEELMVIREDYDGAEPAPNHLAAENLLKLADLLDVPGFAARAESLLRAGSLVLERQPFAAPVLVSALDLHERGVSKIQIPPAAGGEVLAKLRALYQPRAVFTPGSGDEVIVCEGQTCRVFS